MSPDTGFLSTQSHRFDYDITVRRAPDPNGEIVAAVRSWASAFEARHRQAQSSMSEDAELAVHDALADALELKRAELELYQAILAANLIAR